MIKLSAKSMDVQRRQVIWLFLIPGMAYLIFVRIVPAVFTVLLSFADWTLTSAKGPVFVGMANYIELFHDAPFLRSIGRTIVFTVAATAIELVLGFAIAVFMHREFRGKSLVRAALLAPMVITPAIIGVIWYILFHDTAGPINWVLGLLGVGPVGWLSDPDIALVSIIITDVWHWTPFVFLLLLSSMQMIPDELYESAEVDGATGWQATTEITVPMIRDTLLVAVLLRSMSAFEIFAEPFVMTGGGPADATTTISLHIYKSAFLFFKMGYAGAMVVVSILLLLVVFSIYARMVKFE
ncbi:MAG: sugar ABC transporter permease [Casimicrobiaceae bacterium]